MGAEGKRMVNPLAQFITGMPGAKETSVNTEEPQKTTYENPRTSFPGSIRSELKNTPTEAQAEEKRDRRFQALFRPSVFGALEIYCKVHKMSINEALEQFVTTEKHVEVR